jgi:hypothetical protein
MSARELVAADFARVIADVSNPDSMNAWSERVETQTLMHLAGRVDKHIAHLELLLKQNKTPINPAPSELWG